MKKNVFLGSILGIIFGFIFSLPWILCNLYFSISVGYFSILIVFGIILGKKIVCKEMYNTKKIIYI